MGRKLKKAGALPPAAPTPEQIIRGRLRALADREEVSGFLSRLALLAVMLWVMFGCVFGFERVSNNDMSPRLSSGDLLLYYRLQNTLRAQDVIVFEKDGQRYVGRIVARGGETVEVTEDAHLRINNSTVLETDIFYETPRYGDSVVYPLQLAADEYFVLCDYRNGAYDSRYFGPVKQSEIRGNVLAAIRRSGL